MHQLTNHWFSPVAYTLINGSGNIRFPPNRGDSMREKRERWMELAELAANEQDPEKMVEIIHEINRLLEEKEARLNAQRKKHPYDKPE